MRFLVDAQLPPVLARFLSSFGHQADHVFDIDMNTAEDTEIWAYALEVQAVIITKDEDFIKLSLIREKSPSIIWLRIGNTSKQALLKWFGELLPAIEKSLAEGEKLIELM